MSDLTLKEAQLLLGKLTAIHNKLDNEENGAIVKLETILNKIDPTIINFAAKKELETLEQIVKNFENLLLKQQSNIETITLKYSEDMKKMAENKIGAAVNDALEHIEKTKNEINQEKPKEKKSNAALYIAIITFGFALGLASGILIPYFIP